MLQSRGCGFDLERNYQDAISLQEELAEVCEGPAFATNGDQYFARPGPKLLTGATIMALCGYWDQPKVLEAVKALPFAKSALEQYKKCLGRVTPRSCHTEGSP